MNNTPNQRTDSAFNHNNNKFQPSKQVNMVNESRCKNIAIPRCAKSRKESQLASKCQENKGHYLHSAQCKKQRIE